MDDIILEKVLKEWINNSLETFKEKYTDEIVEELVKKYQEDELITSRTGSFKTKENIYTFNITIEQKKRMNKMR